MVAAKFRTDYEAQKWASLANADRAALDRLAAGTATPQDIRRVQSLVTKSYGLATTVFNKGLKAIEAAANDRIAHINDTRVAKGKEPLTTGQFEALLTKALDKAWSDQGPELVVIIEDAIVKESHSQDKRFGSILHDKLRQFHEERAANEASLDEHQKSQDENLAYATLKKVNSIPNIVEERVERAVKRALENYKGPQVVGNPTTEAANSSTATYSPGSVLGTQPGSKEDERKWQTFSRFNEDGELIQVAKENEGATGAVRRSLELIEQQNNQNSRDKDDERRSKTWWRSLKSFMGDKLWGKTKKAGMSIGAGLLALAGKLLMTQLFGGTLWRHLSDYLSVEKIKTYASEFLDWAMEGGKKIVGYINDKLNPFHESNEEIVKKVDNNMPGQEAAIGHSESELARWQAMLAKDPNDRKAQIQVAKYQKLVALQKSGKQNLEDTASMAQANIASGIKTPADFVTANTDKLRDQQKAANTTPTASTTAPLGTASVPTAVGPLTAKGAGKSTLGSGMYDPGFGSAGRSTMFPNLSGPTLSPAEIMPSTAGTSGSSGSSRPITQGTGAPTNSMQDLKRGSSTDGILGAVNLGMLTG
jgi:hypothetical protein